MIYTLSLPLNYKYFDSYENAAIDAIVYSFKVIEHTIKYSGFDSQDCLKIKTSLQLVEDKKYKEALEVLNKITHLHICVNTVICNTESDNIQNNFRLMIPFSNQTIKYIDDKIKVEVFK